MFNLPHDMKRKLISNLLKEFRNILNVSLVIGAELEFYLDGERHRIENLIKDLTDSIDIEEEKGAQQYEIKLHQTNDCLQIAEQIISFRRQIFELAFRHKVVAYFNAKPFECRPGNALHLHINFLDVAGKNIFRKNKDRKESHYLVEAISGLCHLMRESMILFAPMEDCYDRIRIKQNTPTTVSWGGNNRTVSIRIPDSSEENRRLEHRVSSSYADPHLVILGILAGVHYGLTNDLPAVEKIFGDASDEQYRLTKLPDSLAKAEDFFKRGTELHKYLTI